MLDTPHTPTVTRARRLPPTRSLRAFCVAARRRSFKFAADELFLTPSAVSHQMRELEQSLGVRLFERRTRAIELTTAGHALLEEVEPLLQALEKSLAQVAAHYSNSSIVRGQSSFKSRDSDRSASILPPV